jgi:hypothetical protein
MDISQSPFVFNIKIAGVNTAIGFKNKLALAGALQAAHFMGHTRGYSDQIIEIPDADFSAVHEILKPLVKEMVQKKGVMLWYQGIRMYSALTFFRVDARHKLKEVIIMSFKEIVQCIRVAGG